MRNLILIMLPALMLAASCKPNCPETKIPDPVIVKDTVYAVLDFRPKYDSLELVINKLQLQKDSINRLNNRLAT